jgi:hypothetical protein
LDRSAPPECARSPCESCDDQGNTNFVDTQYLLFNVVGLVFALGGFVNDPNAGLPPIPGILVALTSASAATYVSNKAVQDTTPVLSAVVPAKGARGDPVRVLGKNLLTPAGENSYHELFVMFGTEVAPVVGVRIEGKSLVSDDGDVQHLPDHQQSGDDELWVEVPQSANLGALRVTARNFRGVPASDKIDFEVALAGRSTAGQDDPDADPDPSKKPPQSLLGKLKDEITG